MISFLNGTVQAISERFIVVNVGGVGFRVATPARTAAMFRKGESVALATHLHVREDALDLYGFENEEMRALFEMLISVNGVGPKSALVILDIASMPELKAAIKENRPDLLTKAAGVGRKTAERIVLELKSKVVSGGSATTVAAMEGDAELVETLAGLGYKKEQAKAALAKIDRSITAVEARLKKALAILSGRRAA